MTDYSSKTSSIRKVKKVVVALLIVLITFQSFPSTASPSEETMLDNSLPVESLEQFVDRFFQSNLEKYRVPGAAISIVKSQEVLLVKGYGFANLERKIPASVSQTLWRVGSLSKLVTTVGIMQLVEQQKIGLDDPIEQYLKKIEIPSKFNSPITVHHLLTHTDGFDFGWGIGIFTRSQKELTPLETFLKNSLPQRLLPAGELYLYGDVGIALAGRIIENVSGLSFEDYAERNIFSPLKMNRTTFEQPIPLELAQDLAIGYKYDSKTKNFVPRPFAFFKTPPSGALSSTAEDMGHFLVANLSGGKYQQVNVLQAETTEQMQQQQYTVDPLMAGTAYGFKERYLQNQKILEHNGRLNGYNSTLFLVPESNLGVFIGCNNNGGQLVNQFKKDFLDYFYQKNRGKNIASSQEFSTSNLSSERQISGVYRLNQYARYSIDKLGVLLGAAPEIEVKQGNDNAVTISSMPETQWIFVKPSVYRSRSDGAYLKFERVNNRQNMFVSGSPLYSYHKLRWYEPIKFQTVALLICLLILAITLGASVIYFAEINLLQGLVSIPCFLYLMLAIILAVAVFQIDFWQILYGLPSGLKTAKTLVPIAAVLSTVVAALTIFSWFRWEYPLSLRVWYSLLSIALLSITYYMKYWNLL